MALRALPISDTSNGGGGGPTTCTGPLLTAPSTEKGVAIDVSVWRDEERMKKEILAWAKAVAAYSSVATSSSLQPRCNCK